MSMHNQPCGCHISNVMISLGMHRLDDISRWHAPRCWRPPGFCQIALIFSFVVMVWSLTVIVLGVSDKQPVSLHESGVTLLVSQAAGPVQTPSAKSAKVEVTSLALPPCTQGNDHQHGNSCPAQSCQAGSSCHGFVHESWAAVTNSAVLTLPQPTQGIILHSLATPPVTPPPISSSLA